MFLCAVFLHEPLDQIEHADALRKCTFRPALSVQSGLLSATISFPVINGLSYLFVLCGRLKHSALESSKYGKKKWRPTSVYALLWLPSVLYAFCVLVCVCCAFLVLLYGTKMDGGHGRTWLLASCAAILTEALIVRPLFCVLEAAWKLREPPST